MKMGWVNPVGEVKKTGETKRPPNPGVKNRGLKPDAKVGEKKPGATPKLPKSPTTREFPKPNRRSNPRSKCSKWKEEPRPKVGLNAREPKDAW